MRYAPAVLTEAGDKSKASIVNSLSTAGSHARRGAYVGAAAFYALVTLLLEWQTFVGRSSNVVPGVQSRLWPWRGVVDQSQAPFPQRDGAVSSFPWSVTYHNAIQKGGFPLWDWHSFVGGYDLSSDGVSGVMYPVHWIVWAVFSPAAAHDAFVMLHLWLGGLAMFCLLRHWRSSTIASLVGGTVWMLSAFNVVWLQAEMIAPVLIVVPLAFWTVSRAFTRATLLNCLLAAAAIGLGLVAGNIVVFLVVAWLVGMYAVVRLVSGQIQRFDRRRLLSELTTLAAIFGGALCLSAYSLLPTMEYLLTLGRQTASLAQASVLSATVGSSLHGLWNSPAPIASSTDLFALGWCGRVALLLALVGVLGRHRGRLLAIVLVVYFTLLPAVPLFVAAGWYVVPPLHAVSGFGRLLFLSSFGVAILAAAGTDVTVRAVAAIATRSIPSIRRRHAVAVSGGALLGAVTLELVIFAAAMSPPWLPRQDGWFFPETGAQRATAADDGAGVWPGLVLPISGQFVASADPAVDWSGIAFWGSTAHAAGLDSVGGYDSAVPWRAASLTRVMQGTVVSEAVQGFGGAFLPSFSAGWSRLDLMRRVGVTRVYVPPGVALEESAYYGWMAGATLAYSGPDGQVWAVNGAMRSPRLVAHAQLAGDAEDALRAFVSPEFDPATSTILEAHDGPITAGETDAPGSGSALGAVLSSERGSNSAAVTVELNRRGWLVVPIGYSAGWSAAVDGQSVELRAADFAYTAVPVSQGAHRVTFSYRPPGFVLGSALTILSGGAASLGAVAMYARRRVRRVTSATAGAAAGKSTEDPI